jgi:hypothetical protein
MSTVPVHTGATQTPVTQLAPLVQGKALPTHAPDWHASLTVQLLASLQKAPLVLVGFEQTPLPELQVPGVWH